MEVIQQMQNYIADLKATHKTLTQLEKTAANLAAQNDDVCAERTRLEAEIENVERSISALAAERHDLQAEYAMALFNADKDAQERISARREEIDAAIQEYENDLEGFRTELDLVADVDAEQVI